MIKPHRIFTKVEISQMHVMRLQGMTYAAIGKHFACSASKIYNTINRERYNANVRESSQRYYERGCIALVDMK